MPSMTNPVTKEYLNLVVTMLVFFFLSCLKKKDTDYQHRICYINIIKCLGILTNSTNGLILELVYLMLEINLYFICQILQQMICLYSHIIY